MPAACCEDKSTNRNSVSEPFQSFVVLVIIVVCVFVKI